MAVDREKYRIVDMPPLAKEPEHLRVNRQVFGKRKEVHTQAILVLGPLGSGKTSLVKWIISRHGRVMGKLRLIINDVGSENIDATRLAEDANVAQEDLVALKSGCICCEDLESLQKELGGLRGVIDTIVIEPTGIAEGKQIKDSLKALEIPAGVVTLVDVLHHDLRKPVEQQVLDTQLAVADAIGLTWWENASAEQVDEVMEYIGARKKNVPIVKLPKLPFGEREILGEMQDGEYQRLVSAMAMQKEKREFAEKLAEEDQLTPWSERKPHAHHHHNHGHQHAEKAPVFSASFTNINTELTAEDLLVILDQYKNILIRAKGVICGQRFNYVHGSLEWEKAEAGAPRLNFITSESFDQDQLASLLKVSSGGEKTEMEAAHLEQIEQIISKYLAMNKAEILKYSQEEIDKLVAMYERWVALDSEVKELNAAGKVNPRVIGGLQMEQKQLGEAMTFANPLVWLGYKVQAYRGTPKELKTVADLRKHCDSPTYICNKRLTYLNNALRAEFNTDLLNDDSVKGATSLESVLEDGKLIELAMDKDFMRGWQHYEYFRQRQGLRMRVAKWENFVRK